MRIIKTEIENLRQFANWKTDLPAIAVVQGRNGVGKSSLLDILRYCFSRGHNEDIIRAGQNEGTCLLTFDNGGQLKVKADRLKHETVRSYKKPGGKRFEISREEIDRIASAVSYDPLAFMNLPERGTPQKPGQLETLLQVMPIALEPAEVATALGDVKADVPVGLNGFDTLNALYKSLYERRTELNAKADGLNKHAKQLEEALDPAPADAGGWAQQARDLGIKQANLKAELDAITAEAGQQFQLGKEDANSTAATELERIDAEIDAEIRALERKRDIAKQEVHQGKAALIEAHRKKANDKVAEAADRLEPQIEAIGKEFAVAQDRANREKNAEVTRAAAMVALDQASQFKSESAAITAALTRLTELKAGLGAKLNIPDIEIDNGRICKRQNGALVPFATWNKAAKMMFCLKIGVLAHGEAGFLLCDECDSFDKESRDALMEAAQYYVEEQGLQFVMAFVGDEDVITVQAG